MIPSRKFYSLNAGFTLVELMVTIAIVAVLSVMASQKLGNYFDKGRRTQALASARQWTHDTSFVATWYGAMLIDKNGNFLTRNWNGESDSGGLASNKFPWYSHTPNVVLGVGLFPGGLIVVEAFHCNMNDKDGKSIVRISNGTVSYESTQIIGANHPKTRC